MIGNYSNCWVQVTGHYKEDAEEIMRRTAYIVEAKYSVVGKRVSGNFINVFLEKDFFVGESDIKKSLALIDEVTDHLKASFAPSNKIEVSIEMG